MLFAITLIWKGLSISVGIGRIARIAQQSNVSVIIAVLLLVMSDFMHAQRLSNLCRITTRACSALSPMVLAFYSAITGETAKLKSDASVFTIADGIVQHLLVDHLFKGGKFAAIVGEEEGTLVNIDTAPYKVDDLTVPEDFYGIIETARSDLAQLSNEIDQTLYNDLTVFIDPIDGTREFSTGLGEQCSICIGFADRLGKPVAGVVYRPITQPPTYAAGAASESFTDSNLHAPAQLQNPKGLLTSNGGKRVAAGVSLLKALLVLTMFVMQTAQVSLHSSWR